MIKEIKVDVEKCTGCRSCEMACSASHALPRFSSINPARSRIVVIMDELQDVYVPIRAGGYTKAECRGRNHYTIDGKEYSECSFCPASCPSREYFKEPDSGLPLKCDLCEGEDLPLCVQTCLPGALTYEEREEEESREEENESDLETAFKALVEKHGVNKVVTALSRFLKS